MAVEMKSKTLDEYRQEMLNKTFGWLTVLDVFRDEKTHNRLAKCKCKCGNITIKEMRKVYNGHTTSCGCYNTSKEKANKLRQSWANDPERCKSQANKLKQYYENHPETSETISQKVSKFYDENPDKALARGKLYSEWAARRNYSSTSLKIIIQNIYYVIHDNDFFTGDIYSKLGFKLKSLGENSIDYMWVNNSNYRTRHQTMPYKLLKQYPEYNNIEINGSKENYIMEDLGYCKVYRCGNSIWEWHH